MINRQPPPGVHENFAAAIEATGAPANLIKVEPGDRFVIRLDGKASLEMVERLQAVWRNFAGKEARLLVLDKGAELSILRQQDTPPPESHVRGSDD